MRLVAVFAALVLAGCSNNPEAAPTVFPPQPSAPVNVAGTWLASWGVMSGSGHFCGATATLDLTQTGSTIGGTYSNLVVNCDSWTGNSVGEWKASKKLPAGTQILDANDNIEQITVAGTTGATVPTWNTTVGGTTSDGTITWTNMGSRFATATFGTVTGQVSGYNITWDLTNALAGSSSFRQSGVSLNGNPTVSAWKAGSYAAGDVVYDANGNLQEYALEAWASGSYAVGDEILDGNGNIERSTVAGTTGATAPTWNKTVGGTTTDGGVTWTNLGTKAPSGATAPAWNTTVSGTTIDGSIIWTNLGSRFQLTGTSLWTNTNYRAMGIVPACGNTVANADPAGCADTLVAAVGGWASGTYAVGDRTYDSNDNVEEVTVPGATGIVWKAGTYAVGDKVYDSNNNIEQCTVAGTTGTTWKAGTYVVGNQVYDSNNNVEQVTVAGTSGATQPKWNKTVGGTTTDGGITWTNQGPRWNSTVGGTTTDGTVTWTNQGPRWNATVGGTTTDGAVTWKNLGSRFLMADTATIARIGSNFVATSH